MMIAGGIIGGYSAKAVTFDGTNDYLSRTAQLDGIADGKLGTLSLWINGAQPATSRYVMYFGTTGRFSVLVISTDGSMSISGRTSAGANMFAMNSSTNPVADGSWHHVLASWDTSDTNKCKFYLDDADVTTVALISNNDIDYATAGNIACGAGASGNFRLGADVAEFYFTTEWLDLTDSAVRAKFIKAGRPVSLGADGSKPTGTAALLYLKGPASNWGTNAGSGGNFTVNGTFTDASTAPSL